MNGPVKHVLVLFLLTVACYRGIAGNDTTALSKPDSSIVNNKRLAAVIVTQSALYAGSLTGLYYLWYADYPKSAFHLFNDNGEWLQMDKAGHVTSAFLISNVGYASYRWAGVERKKAIWLGGLVGWAFMTNIEILDGFSSEWGFSLGDMAANTAGCFIFIGQQLLWDQQRFKIKYSFHTTEYADYRPDLLGENFIQQMVKDYNGQTYWLSGNISSFLPKTSKFPRWINVAVGYGAEGMTGANENPEEWNGQPIPPSERYRQFYFSLDVDLSRIRTKSKTLHTILSVVNVLKLPFPTLEFNTKGQVVFHPIYF